MIDCAALASLGVPATPVSLTLLRPHMARVIMDMAMEKERGWGYLGGGGGTEDHRRAAMAGRVVGLSCVWLLAWLLLASSASRAGPREACREAGVLCGGYSQS